jgi:hypothetical protein
MKFLFFLLIFLPSAALGQCMLLEIPLKERVQNAQIIIEGKVKASAPFLNQKVNLIQTAHTIEVYKYLKGTSTESELILITEGGILGDQMHRVDPSLQTGIGEAGIFFLYSSSVNYHLPYAGPQGMIKYHIGDQKAHDPFQTYDIENLIQEISQLAGEKIKIIKPVNSQEFGKAKSAMNISGFSPASLSAGTEDILTIIGSGFGSSRTSNDHVEFRNANDGGASFITPLASEYVSWSDNQIRVKVPSNAGTGFFRVVKGAQTINAPSLLTVEFSHLNSVSGSLAHQTSLINKSGGGYEWRMSSNFAANTNAVAGFTRALEKWRCGTFVNWRIGNETSTNVTASDNICIIRFDAGSELPSGVLGVCYSYWNSCLDGAETEWYVNELDIVFDDATNWHYGTASPPSGTIDFESVAVHELGHGLQLGHVINSSGIMHFSLSAGQAKRILATNDLNGGNFVREKSSVKNTCSMGSMTALNSSTCALSGTQSAAIEINISSGSNPTCEGASIFFTASAVNAGTNPTFQWHLNDLPVGINSDNFSSSEIQNTDVIKCVLTSSMSGITGSPATSNIITMTVLPRPQTPTITAGENDTLISSEHASFYDWRLNELIFTGNTKKIKPEVPGNYTVRTYENEDCASDFSEPFFFSPLKLNSLSKHQYSVFPNPTAGELTVTGLTEQTSFTVFDNIGKIIASGNISPAEPNIDLSKVAPGIYFIHFLNKNMLRKAKVAVIKEG